MSDDDSWSAEITRRRVLGGLLTVGAASSAAGAGTMALFSDTEQSTGNSVQAGTLDLSVAGESTNTVLNVDDAKPGQSGSQSATVRNGGTLPGYLQFGILGVRSHENGVNEPEAADDDENDPLGPDSGDEHTGELAQNVELRMKIVDGDEEQWVVGSEASSPSIDGFVLAANVRFGPRELDELRLADGDEVELVTEYDIYGAGNEIQSDSLEIDLAFGLAQEASQPVVDEPTEIESTAVRPDDGQKSGVRFDLTNEFDREATVDAIHVQPADTDLELLSDGRSGTDYESFDYESDVHVDPDNGTVGWVDGGNDEFPVPGWIDFANDGWGEKGRQQPVLSADTTATVTLYAFRNRSGERVDMTDERLRVTVDVTLANDSRETIAVSTTPE